MPDLHLIVALFCMFHLAGKEAKERIKHDTHTDEKNQNKNRCS